MSLCTIRFYVFLSVLTLLPVYVGSTKLSLEDRNKQRLVRGEPFGNYLKKEGVNNFICVLWDERRLPEWSQERWDIENRLMEEFKTWHEFGTGGRNFARAGGITSEDQAAAFRSIVSANTRNWWSNVASQEEREKRRKGASRMHTPEALGKRNATRIRKGLNDQLQDAREKTPIGWLIVQWMRLQSPGFRSSARAARVKQRTEQTPAWVWDDAEVKRISSYSKNPQLRQTVIDLHWRQGLSRGQISKELAIEYNRLSMMIRAISRVSEGRTANGMPRRRTDGVSLY